MKGALLEPIGDADSRRFLLQGGGEAGRTDLFPVRKNLPGPL
jgi:hypothetical protein